MKSGNPQKGSGNPPSDREPGQKRKPHVPDYYALCRVCGGVGEVWTRDWPMDEEYLETCPECDGTGEAD